MGIWFLDNAFRFRRTDDLSDTAKRVSLDNDVIEGEYTVIETTNRSESMLDFTECKTHQEIYVSRNNVQIGTIRKKKHQYMTTTLPAVRDCITVFQFQSGLKRDNFPLRVSRKAAELDAEAHDEEARCRQDTPLPSTF